MNEVRIEFDEERFRAALDRAFAKLDTDLKALIARKLAERRPPDEPFIIDNTGGPK